MSNPDTQNSTADPKTSGVAIASKPRIAIQAATGAIMSEAPSQKWASAVNRLVNEYAQMKRRSGTARIVGHIFGGSINKKSVVEATKARPLAMVNAQTERSRNWPDGKCRFAVRGFRASIRRS